MFYNLKIKYFEYQKKILYSNRKSPWAHPSSSVHYLLKILLTSTKEGDQDKKQNKKSGQTYTLYRSSNTEQFHPLRTSL